MPNIPRLLEDQNGVKDIYVQLGPWALRGSINTLGQEANGASTRVAMAQQAPVIVFSSDASNLVPDDRNRTPDIFVATVRVPVWECVPEGGGGGGGGGGNGGGGGGNRGGAGGGGGGERGGVEEPFSSCQETDGGPDPYRKGMVIAVDEEGNIQTAADHCCGGSKIHLEEANCVDGVKHTDWYRCTGCRDGACIRAGGWRFGAERLGREPRDCHE